MLHNKNTFNYTGTRYEINVTDQTMYQLGNHFNCHGKPEMGYASKKEYQQAAYDFALEARKSPNAKIYIGTWNGRGTLNNTDYYALSAHELKCVQRMQIVV